MNIPLELIEDIVYSYQRYCNAASLDVAASHLVELSNRISDLKTYHPGYDYSSGTMPWERDDYEG